MLAEVLESSPGLSEIELAALEKAIAIKLPVQYRTFLSEHNGGRPVPNTVGIPSHPERFLPLHYFLEVGGTVESTQIEWAFRYTRGDIPGRFLPIANSGTGDYYCINITVDDCGGVYFWDSHLEPGISCEENIFKVADSFLEFLSCFEDFPD